MLFGKKKTVETVFAGHYKAMLKIAKSSSVAQNPEFELKNTEFSNTARNYKTFSYP